MKRKLLSAILASAMTATMFAGSVLAEEAFNPDVETDKIAYEDLEATFGPLDELELPEGIQMGGILKNQANEAWLSLGDGMTEMAEAHGATMDIQATRTETDTAGQLSIMETMLQNNYSALVLAPLTNECLDSAVATAKEAGVPIVNANCEYIADANVYVGGSQIDIGYKAADYIAEKLGGKGTVAIIEGVAGTFTSIQRTNGFEERIEAEYPDITIVASVPADYEMEKGMNVATDILTQNPDISAIYCCNDNMALGAVEALRAADKMGDVIVTGVDGTGDAYKSIEAGELTATVDQFMSTNGAAAVEVALRLMAGQEIPRVVATPIEVVDAENAAEFSN
ncbi:MAG: substrate-binding domain-containing protein [Lachnospiraceae bacterium]|nr:substrate-binding domain-containing protein [Lachnospiraceae bacterium]